MKTFSGYFITLEGGEGAGKTTLLNQLAAFLAEQGYQVVVTREPGGTPLGEAIRNWLLGRELPMGARAELLLFLAARAQQIEEKIRPALEAGKVVLCDRFNDSTIAYQGGARGLGVGYVRQLCELVCGSMIPQLTLLLTVPPEVGLARSRRRSNEQAPSGQLDRIESEALEFHHTLQQTLERLAQQEPTRIHTLDATRPQHLVYNEAVRIIQNIFKHSGGSEEK